MSTPGERERSVLTELCARIERAYAATPDALAALLFTTNATVLEIHLTVGSATGASRVAAVVRAFEKELPTGTILPAIRILPDAAYSIQSLRELQGRIHVRVLE